IEYQNAPMISLQGHPEFSDAFVSALYGARRGKSLSDAQVDAALESLTRAERSEEHTSELQSLTNLVCRLLLEKKKTTRKTQRIPPSRRRSRGLRRPRGDPSHCRRLRALATVVARRAPPGRAAREDEPYVLRSA